MRKHSLSHRGRERRQLRSAFGARGKYAMTAFQVRKEVLPPGPRSPSAVQLAWVIARPTAYWKACAKRYGDPFTLRPHMKTITLQVILRTVFGLDQGDQLRRLTADLTELLEVAGSPFLLLLPGMLDRAWFGPWKR